MDNKEFDEFLEQTFIDSMNSDYMNMHFGVIDYRSFNIDKPPVDLGEVKYGFDQENHDFFLDQLKQLQEFDYDISGAFTSIDHSGFPLSMIIQGKKL